jgi:hypothetical protein
VAARNVQINARVETTANFRMGIVFMGFLFLPTCSADKTDSLIIRYFDSA